MGACFASPRDIRGNILLLRGSFALCPCVFTTLNKTKLQIFI